MTILSFSIMPWRVGNYLLKCWFFLPNHLITKTTNKKCLQIQSILKFMLVSQDREVIKNKTNHPISSNSDTSATANKVRYCLKLHFLKEKATQCICLLLALLRFLKRYSLLLVEKMKCDVAITKILYLLVNRIIDFWINLFIVLKVFIWQQRVIPSLCLPSIRPWSTELSGHAPCTTRNQSSNGIHSAELSNP